MFFCFTFSSYKSSSAYSCELREVVASLGCFWYFCLKRYLRSTECQSVCQSIRNLWNQDCLLCEQNVCTDSTSCHLRQKRIFNNQVFLQLQSNKTSIDACLDLCTLQQMLPGWMGSVLTDCALFFVLPASQLYEHCPWLDPGCRSSNTVFMFIALLIHTLLNDLGRMLAYYSVTLTFTSMEPHIGITSL